MEKLVMKHFHNSFQKGEYVSGRQAESLPSNVTGRLLEVGCGGRLTYCSGQMELCGLDITRQLIKSFKKSYPSASATMADAKALPFRNGVFDVVVSNNLLHHLVGINPRISKDKMKRSIHEINRVSDSNACLLIKETFVKNAILSFIFFYVTLLCAKFNIDLDFFDIHSGVVTCFLTEKQFNDMASTHGFEVWRRKSEEWILLRKIVVGEYVELLIFV